MTFFLQLSVVFVFGKKQRSRPHGEALRHAAVTARKLFNRIIPALSSRGLVMYLSG